MGQHNLTHYITNYYTCFYTLNPFAPSTTEAQKQCWHNVPTKVKGNMNSNLIRNLTLSEIHDAIRALPKGKALGHDGVPMEFFHECAQEVALDLLQAFMAMLSKGATSAFINKGLITLTLIPKSGDHTRLSNWRLITLLGNTYKILVKVLAGKVQAALPHIVRPNQTGFVEGRSILDNAFMAQEALDWAEESDQDLVLLLLDFEKAFDKIEWGFLFTALVKFGFDDTWALSHPYFGQVWG